MRRMDNPVRRFAEDGQDCPSYGQLVPLHHYAHVANDLELVGGFG